MRNLIPKIIHHIAPADTSKWHPMWFSCLDSWKQKFPESEYTHVMWDDQKGIDDLVEKEFSHLKDFYHTLPIHIMRIDFVKYLIVLKYGGIYVDMDMYCYKNFYDKLDSELFLTRATSFPGEFINCMLMAVPNNDFLNFFVNNIVKDFYYHNQERLITNRFYVEDTVGSRALNRSFLKYDDKDSIGELDSNIYCHPEPLYYNEKMITRHMFTCYWGKEFYEESKDKIKEIYWDHWTINTDDWDYHTNYWRHGGFDT